MKIRWSTGVATAVLGFALVAQAGASGEKAVQAAAAQVEQEQSRIEALQQKLEQALAERHARLQGKMDELARLRRDMELRLAEKQQAWTNELQERLKDKALLEQELAERAYAEAQLLAGHWGALPQIWVSTDGGGWLGITIEEVNADRVKELKLPAERGAYIKEVSEDSPALKAGLKAGDVVTEFNGQRIESAAQLTRMVRETPSGRTVQLTVWREGRAQQISVQLSDARERIRSRIEDRIRVVEPPDVNFSFNMPRFELFGAPTPLLGIQADDLSGQLGAYFGAPDGEGVLVREVNSGSPAEKAGLKSGDVITKVDGERVRSTSELRSELRERRDKDSVDLTVMRNKAETTVKVTIEKPKPPESRRSRAISRKVST